MANTYFTKPGDTLESLAKLYNVSTETLLGLNPWLKGFSAGAIPITGAPVATEQPVQRSPVVEALISGDIDKAVNYIVGQGVSLQDVGLLGRILPELSSAFEGRQANLIAQYEQAGQTGLAAPSLSPLDFLEQLRKTGTLAAMMQNPSLSGMNFPNPAVTSRRLRF